MVARKTECFLIHFLSGRKHIYDIWPRKILIICMVTSIIGDPIFTSSKQITMKTTFNIKHLIQLNKKFTILCFTFFAFGFYAVGQTNATLNVLQAPCNNNGIIEVQFTNLTPPINVTWYSTSGTINHVVNTTADTLFNWAGGYVYISAYDVNTFQAFASTQGSPPFTYTVNTTGAICPAMGTATAIITGGTAPYTVQWLDVTTNTTVATGNPASLPSGFYGILITDNAGCTFGSYANYDSIYINNISPVAFNINTTIAQCTNGTASAINITGGLSPYSFQWNNGANTQSINGLVQGQYTLTVTDAQGCYSTQYCTIQQNPQITVMSTPTAATCLQNDGSAIAFGSGGSSPYTYQWSNGQTTATATSLISGLYTVLATDANGCIGNGYAYINASTPISVTYSSTPSSCTAPTGTATVNPSGGTSPYTITWYTYPAQTGFTATNLMAGNYSFEVTDANGCVRSGVVTVSPISIITASVNTTPAFCTQSNGSASVMIMSGTPPYSFNWSSGGSSSSINNQPAGGYSCTITDNAGCSINKYAYINSYSPVNIGFNNTSATCIYNNDGGSTAIVNGGTPPYSYSWSNGSTAASASNLATGNYSVFVQDNNGCTAHASTNVFYNTANNSCYCTLTGVVYDDANGNCIQDAGENGIQNIMIHCSNIGYTYTNSNGVYSFIVPSGTYTVSEVIQSFYPLAACQSNNNSTTVTASSGCSTTINFANSVNPIHDISVYNTSYNSLPIPGHTYQQTMVFQNSGTLTETNVQAGYLHDGQLSLNSFSPSLFVQQNTSTPNWNSIINSFPSFSPGGSLSFQVQYTVPTNIPLATSILIKDTAAYDAPISNWLNDYSPWNNVGIYQPYVVGSYDPNYKEVSPRGIGAQGFISTNDSVLTYTIHFQNTGTYWAENVSVIDTLDSNLNIETLNPIYSDHAFTTSVSENGVVKFNFPNIHLADSSNHSALSTGFVMFSIHLKPNLSNGTVIHNQASIYFDFNAPVATNTTVNTIDNTVAVNPISVSSLEASLFPNPATENLNVIMNHCTLNSNISFSITDMYGKKILNETMTTSQTTFSKTISVADLSAGIYFLEMKSGNEISVKKFVVLH